MANTTKLDLPLLAAAQAQKHITMNEALTRLDAAFQMGVKSCTTSVPPVTFEEGDAYLVPVGAVNEWSGEANNLAFSLNGGWDFLAPRPGWQIWVEDSAERLSFGGDRWSADVLAASAHGAALRAEVIEADVEVENAGASILSSLTIPASTSVWGVTGRVISGFSGSLTHWSLGVEGGEDRYGSQISPEAGAWLRGLSGQPMAYYEPVPLKITAIGGDIGTGTVRLAIHLMRFDLPRA